MSDLARPEVLLLDAGNTLVYLDHEALARAAATIGVEVSGHALAQAEPRAKMRYEAALERGMSHEEGWFLYLQTIYEVAGLAAAEARAATSAARREHDEFNLWRKVPEGLTAALAAGKAHGLRYGIISNSEGKLVELLERLELAHFFEVVIDSANEGVRKPDPEIFVRALERLRLAPRDALYAGDIPQVDVDGARAAGIDAVLIDTLDHFPDYVGAPRFASVAALLQRLCG